MPRFIIIILSLTLLISCSEVVVPDIKDAESFLVIEGSYSTQAGKHFVFVYHSNAYTNRPYFPAEEDATVFVSDTFGNRIYYEDMGSGIYGVDLGPDEAARIGNRYYLEVQTSDRNIFRSTLQQVVPCPEIRNLYCRSARNVILTEDAYGQPLEVDYDGITINIEIDGILSSDNYYRYDYDAYEEHLSIATPGGGAYWYMYQHRVLNQKYASNIHTVNADEFGNFRVRNDEYMFIITEDMRNFTPIIPDTVELISTQFTGLLFTLRQYSLSPDAYRFYRDAEQQLDAEGHLFDPAFTQITGNIECITDPEKEVVGVFYTPDIKIHHAYFYIDLSKRTYSRELDSLPELWLDTCSFGKPETWIDPPF